ncbi:MAG: hypothetical protein M3340_18555, partial [Actinomycetota bacterium]|nr:hypothetical protein [Actinomycetota bacterium]
MAALAARGAEAAFEAVFDRHGQDVYRFCCAMAGVRDGEELFARAMPRMLDVLTRLDGPADLKRLLVETVAEVAPPIEPPARGTAAGGVTAGGVLVAFERLSRTERGSIVLRELGGLGYRAIGDVLGVNPATVRELVGTARAALAPS